MNNILKVESLDQSRPKLFEKIAYGMGDAGCNIVGGAVFLFLNFFYTDVYGLSAFTVGLIWFGVRLIEAISDPFIGSVADRTETRWGKFRPYILFFAFPYSVFTILMYTVPDLSYNAKALYAFVTFLLMSVTYSFINIPYCALGSVMSYNAEDRVSCQSYRFMGVGIATLILTLTLIPLVEWLGAGDQAKGYQYTIIILTILGFILFLMCFLFTKERVKPIVENKDPFITNLKDCLRNDQWLRLLLLTFVNVLPGFIRMGAVLYFLNYVMHVSTIYITVFLSVGVIGMILGSALAKPLSDRFCKLRIFYSISIVLFIYSFGLYFVNPDLHILYLILYFGLNVIHQIAQPINWSIMGDVDDYGEIKVGKRLTGMNFSFNFLALKLGLTTSGVAINFLLSFSDYQPNVIHQNSVAEHTILLLFTVIPAVGYLLTAFCVRLLKVDRKMMFEIEKQLKIRRGNI